ncbi:coenzyme Q-binding protein COQ10-like protein, mitochondrial-like [Euroglyphus maynei]|uniref:Coenzyme Q-binding protein COQ10-like protein, mitochondrial-like n=1 Tax=Euroglyphus maynei TaxID=6958 RepID=A0A1Y3AP19_EURMA|nr:coenzyme Q-binding protein COQ10-like protein, mitochondrial-like [Euroglyphus maynei]
MIKVIVMNLPIKGLFTKTQIYNVVANVDDYDQFLPNCLESTVRSRSDNRMEAELVVGFPPLITEKYTSIIYLDKPNHVLVKGIDSTILKHLESEWKFEELNKKRTLVTFNVKFEFHSTIHSRFMSMFFDDFTKKTMKAFLDRAYIIYSADPLYFDTNDDKS